MKKEIKLSFTILLLITLIIGCASISKKQLIALNSETVNPGGKSPSESEIALGKVLFFDTRLSGNDSISCATCHQPEKGFGDGQKFSKGVPGKPLKRHTPHLFNLAWNSHFFWDGRVQSLEDQVMVVIPSPEEMDMPFDKLIPKFKKVSYYKQAFKKVYPESGITPKTIAKAISAFERTLVSYDSPFDRYMNGDKTAMSPRAAKGMALFTGKANCAICHNGPNFTDGEFHNNGVLTKDPGRAAIDKIGMKKEFEMTPYPFFSSFSSFKTPSLRNVALTAPYMHDGSEPRLEDVVRFYNQGGKNPDKRGLARGIEPLSLREDEINDLVAFLKALTSPVEIAPPKLLGYNEIKR